MEVKGEIDSNTIIVGDVNNPHKSMDRSSRQKINKETSALNDTNQMVLIDTYTMFHPKATEYTFFSSAHGTFSGIDHMISLKTSLNKFKIEIISSIFLDHKGMKFEVTQKKRKLEKSQICGD